VPREIIFLGGIFQFNQAKISLSEAMGFHEISFAVVIENIGNIQFGANLR